MHFKTPQNEIKCVLSIKKSNFNGKKMGQNFHIFLKCVLSIKESNFNGKNWSKFLHMHTYGQGRVTVTVVNRSVNWLPK